MILNLNDSTPTTGETTYLGAGTHTVKVAELKYVTSKDKGLCVFQDANGAKFMEWLNVNTPGSRKRTRVFLAHLCNLCGLPAPEWESLDFNRVGESITGMCPDLTIRLADSEYNGSTRTVLDGYFDNAITLAAGGTQSDDEIPF